MFTPLARKKPQVGCEQHLPSRVGRRKAMNNEIAQDDDALIDADDIYADGDDLS
jgi:hypothetical protein